MVRLTAEETVLANIWLSEWTGDGGFTWGNWSEAKAKHMNRKYLTIYGLLGAAQGAL